MESQVTGRLEALFRALFQAVVHNAVERRGNTLSCRQQVRRVFFQNGTGSIGRSASFKSALPGETLVEHRAKTEYIGALVGSLSHLFG